ncbi:MAG: hypothetical protein SWH61_10415 [Thermodesulfobacteriota bacterium]|nr:hypothetical protein [Thermodesulfobacteriota bacterium]
MTNYINDIPYFVSTIKSLADTIITNIVLIGQVPSPTFEEHGRADALLERLSESGVEQCTTDSIGNPVGIIKGGNPEKPPIFVVAHLDTVVDREVDHNYTVKKNTLSGAGLLDNSIGIGVLASLPDIFKACDLSFASDIVLAGVVRSIGKGNLEGINTLLGNWKTPIRGGVCVEGRELGRLSYSSEGVKRCDITCSVGTGSRSRHRMPPNAILVLNEIINQILELRLPQRPLTRVILGRITGGSKHGVIAHTARLGFEIQSDSAEMVKSVYSDIKDIVDGAGHEFQVSMRLKSITEQAPSRLTFSHPLVKATVEVMKKLKIDPVNMPSESELSAFLSRRIPAVTLGITHGEESFVPEEAKARIEPMFKGIAQIVAVIRAMDSGVCDDN